MAETGVTSVSFPCLPTLIVSLLLSNIVFLSSTLSHFGADGDGAAENDLFLTMTSQSRWNWDLNLLEIERKHGDN